MKYTCPRCGSKAIPGGFRNLDGGKVAYCVCQNEGCFHQFKVSVETGERIANDGDPFEVHGLKSKR